MLLRKSITFLVKDSLECCKAGVGSPQTCDIYLFWLEQQTKNKQIPEKKRKANQLTGELSLTMVQ